MKLFLTLITALLISLPTLAQTPAETPPVIPSGASSEAEIELRAREVGRAIRCVVCQNQSIDESDASLAQDMRKLVRARIRAGDSNEQVITFMQDRYGDFVLLKPPVQANTYLLWFAPAVLFGFFLLWYLMRVRRRPTHIEIEPLSADELHRFEKLSDKQENSK